MIYIKSLIKYTKKLGIFLLIEIFLAFFMSFFNLIGVNSSLTKIIIFITNIIVFAIFAFINGKTTNKKGFIEGIITGLLLIIPLFLISLIFFKNNLSLGTSFYYICLFTVSTVFATIGKNKKVDSKQD